MEAVSDVVALVLLVAFIGAVALCGWAGWVGERHRTREEREILAGPRPFAEPLTFADPREYWCKECPAGTWHATAKECR